MTSPPMIITTYEIALVASCPKCDETTELSDCTLRIDGFDHSKGYFDGVCESCGHGMRVVVSVENI